MHSSYKIKIILINFIILFTISCKNDVELAMERGILFYEWNKLEKAIIEFKYVIHKLGSKIQLLDYNEIKLLSKAHYNLAVAYSKKQWYDNAIKEAKQSFDLIPSDKNKKILELIRTKQKQKSEIVPMLKKPIP